jgi:GTP-binding protein Era
MNSEVFKSGFVAVIGRPNVGKSTLINSLMGQKIAAVSPRPQMTRRQQLGILTSEQGQVIFVDTPGIHKPEHLLGEYMNQEALVTLEDADVILWVVEAHRIPELGDELCAAYLQNVMELPPVILGLNKIDKADPNMLESVESAYLALVRGATSIRISAINGTDLDQLMKTIYALLPEGPPYYDPEQITDLYEREIAADLVREAALLHLRDEVPHGIAIRIDEFRERGDTGAYIHATIFVERESHKGIVIGKGGKMLKEIGKTARLEIEAMSGRKVFLEVRVKVNKNWRKSFDALSRFGYTNK